VRRFRGEDSGQVFFLNNTLSSTSELLIPNMYCWSCKNTYHHILDTSQNEWHLGTIILLTENE